MAIRVRDTTPEELDEIKRLAHSRTEPARAVERARIVWLSRQGKRVPGIAKELQVTQKTVRLWLKRFNDHGVDGLLDRPRSGHPLTYTPEQVSEVIAAALSKPQELQLPFASWTLDRLQAYLNEVKGIAMKRSRIDELLLREGLRWRKEETWFGERVDPDFAEKRGSSRSCTRNPQQAA